MPKPPARHKRPSQNLWVETQRRDQLRWLATGALALQSASALCAEPADTEMPYDWHPKETLTAEQLTRVGPGCDGLYIDPTRDRTTGDAAPIEEQPLYIDADSSEVTEGETARLEGSVEVSQGDREIKADRMIYNMVEDTAALEGNVSIRQPGLLLRGSGADAKGTDHSAEFRDAQFVLHEQHLRGNAKSIEQTPDKVIRLREGQFTSCEPGNRSWLLEGEEITIDTESNWGTGRNIKLKIMNVPLIYLPYISFPVSDERKSGFLFPSLSVSEKNGLDISTPYYLNLAPNYDATITPRYIGKRGGMLELEGRHLNSHFASLANVAFLANDRGGRTAELDERIAAGELTEAQAVPYKGENRWLGHFEQNGGTGSTWFSEINYTRVSDNDYFRDLGTNSISLQNTTHLNQSASVGAQFDHWQLRALAQDYQVLLYDVDDPYRRMPQIDLDGQYQVGPISTSLENQITRFDHPDDNWRNGNSIIKGSRFNSDYRMSANQRYPWGFVKPQLGVQTLHYELDQDALAGDADANPTLVSTLASFDSGVIFEHPGGVLLQTLEPRVFYLYRSYADHSELYNVTDDGQNVNFDTSQRTFSYSQLYRDSRFIGGDRLDDANRVTIGVTSNWFGQNTGNEYFSISLGQIFHFDSQRVALTEDVSTEDKSEFAGDMRLRLGERGRLYASAVYDGENSVFKRGDAGIQYRSENSRTLVNLGYSYIRRETASTTGIDQVDGSFVTPVNAQWTAMGRYNYDFGSKTELESFLGLEYNDCCYRVRVLARRWLDSNIAPLADSADALYDRGLFVEFHLKGLGSSGARVNSILEDSIYGYRERENYLNQKK
ncbi:LPS-assembly protein LptD [Teredinibacter turnerae]|uniref:LPS-assembly protein LptD n=1 Tax=Teredinibacter turnerae TaxID=2426 RepID=UPI000362CCFA|nr:LPS-assembly protein LptD [Teredinibacter turnerae]